MRSPSRPPQSNQLFTFVMLSVLSLLVWGIAIGVWYYVCYYWYGWSERTFPLTFLALPIPFLAFRAFTGSSGLPTERPHTEAGAAAPSPAPSAPAAAPSAPATAPAANPFNDWLIWLGNGERHRGTMVILIFAFWTILYWSLPTISFTALTFSAWGLLTILGVMILRFFFRPSREVSAANETKSRAK
jgi:hypothetical protein